ncbi:MAG: carboxy terminal-processing peptidase [Methylophilaceae bacterium]|nr:carboxy terminal-processing peptidase [Methylophilaceae bacterium]
MKNKLRWLLLAFTSATLITTQAATAPISPLQQQSQAAYLSAEVFSRYHYKSVPLDDATSSKIFDNYLKALDGEKVFFIQADINQFANARTKLDDAILNEDLSIPFAIHNLYQQRLTERINYARSLLKQGFDFKTNESYQYAREKAAWPKSEEELNDLWRKRVKNDWLRLKLAGKDTKNITDTLNKRYDNSLKSIAKVKSDDVFQSFMNAYAMTIDPHTNYFGIRASEDFDISMRLSLVGIGAVLQDKDEYTTIRELVAGGPAALSGKLNVGDRIVGVGQGEKNPPTEVLGWRLDDTVALIRGAEDSVVLLDVLPAEAGPDGKHKLIALVRKKISLDNQAAKKSIIEVKEGDTTRHIGVISLPGFYQDFTARQKGDKNYKSATRDVARLLEELKKDKVDSVLVDLRNNGGGSLDEAVELTGLFIDKGPVLQQRDSKGNIKVETDVNDGLAWNGSLGVLINRASASASEIFAAAIQDYGRGIVIGEPSFGKGTVQSVVNLDQLARNEQPRYGELKMTIAQFFRINGGTTQLRGVTPDISLPSMTNAEDYGESSYDNALPWTQIQAADYKPTGNLTDIVPLLTATHNARISKDKDFQFLQQDIAELVSLRKKNLISLNEAERRKERATQEAKLKSREKATESVKTGKTSDKKAIATKSATPQDDGLLSNERNLSADIALEKARKDAKDVLLTEAAHILSDEVGLLKADAKLSASVLPKVEVR